MLASAAGVPNCAREGTKHLESSFSLESPAKCWSWLSESRKEECKNQVSRESCFCFFPYVPHSRTKRFHFSVTAGFIFPRIDLVFAARTCFSVREEVTAQTLLFPVPMADFAATQAGSPLIWESHIWERLANLNAFKAIRRKFGRKLRSQRNSLRLKSKIVPRYSPCKCVPVTSVGLQLFPRLHMWPRVHLNNMLFIGHQPKTWQPRRSAMEKK